MSASPENPRFIQIVVVVAVDFSLLKEGHTVADTIIHLKLEGDTRECCQYLTDFRHFALFLHNLNTWTKVSHGVTKGDGLVAINDAAGFYQGSLYSEESEGCPHLSSRVQ